MIVCDHLANPLPTHKAITGYLNGPLTQACCQTLACLWHSLVALFTTSVKGLLTIHQLVGNVFLFIQVVAILVI